MIARETGWSYHDIMWEIPISVTTQILDVILSEKGVELRWSDQSVDIDQLLDG